MLASGPEQLAQRGADFAAHPDPRYWLQSPSADGTPALVGRGVTPEATQCYAQHYRELDPLWDAAMQGYAQAGPGGTWVVTDLPAGRRTCHAGFYNDFLRPHGIGARIDLGNKFYIDGAWVDPITATPFAIMNPASNT